mgnify:CR=1 FL=1
MTEVRIESTSLEYLTVTVLTEQDPTANTIQMCVVTTKAAPTGFQTAEWYTTPQPVGDKYKTKARVLVGPTSDIGTLTNGTYDTYLKGFAKMKGKAVKGDSKTGIRR